ncbi:MAG: GntR family transcriptional regulator [Acidimicrobiales bacterium]|nr:GntR family transcriptional regulator [Acidimicrobiales bacterium]
MGRAADLAYDQIRKHILDGTYPAGFHLKEEVIASSVGASRTPVREALSRLSSESLVDFVAHQGMFVANWATEDLDEIFGLRALLESYGCRLAAQRISTEMINKLDALACEMSRAHGSDGEAATDHIATLNNEFHQVLIEASGNRRLVSMVRHIVAVPLVHRTFHRYDEEALNRSLASHHELVIAMRERDPDWAASIMQSHILAARATLRTGAAAATHPNGEATQNEPLS